MLPVRPSAPIAPPSNQADSAQGRYAPELLSRLYYDMVLIRVFEERVARLHGEGLIRGSTHLCIGQEATAAGACAALRPDDLMTCTYRGHGQSLAKSMSPRAAMAEIMGRATGCCRGRGGSMHLTDLAIGHLGENGVVGGGVPIACGAAFSAKMRGSRQVTIAFFGEGATNQGMVHEALNLAAAWSLPVLFFCENNVYAEMTPIAATVKVPSMTPRAEGNGVPSIQVDGNDVLAVYEAVRAATDRAREGDGPTFVEAHTYRLCGHMVGDREVYRTQDEVEQRRQNEPIRRFRAVLRADFGYAPETLDVLDRRATAAVDDAEAFARNSPFPDPASAGDDVYA